VDALQHAEHLDSGAVEFAHRQFTAVWHPAAPAAPCAEGIEAARLRVLIDHARRLYDWVILDLPTVFQRNSMMAISECERAFLVSTAELPSLH